MTAKKISDIFEAYPKSTADLMRERGQGFYIPAYQRRFSWGRANIERLFDDAVHGIDQLLDQNDATTFIGTLITIHDTSYVTVDPIVRGQVPSKVMTVIDGQQRLTTLLLTNMALHHEIRRRYTKFSDESDSAALWIHRQSLQTQSELLDTLEEDMSHGDGHFQWYPRMTRAYDDRWSRYAAEAMYQSEIAKLLHQYGIHHRDNGSNAFQPDPENPIGDSYSLIRRTLRSAIARARHDEIEFPEITRFGQNSYLALALFNDSLPPEVVNRLHAQAGAQSDFVELFRLLVFARFVLHRVAVTVVTARSEDHAFDMFESLNTTGEPLTAFETFRPRVIREEGQSQYQASEARKFVGDVEHYLDTFRTAQNRLVATSNLLIPFALAESGVRLSKRLSDQRRYLRKTYDELDSGGRDSFLCAMADTARLLETAWDSDTWAASGPALAGLDPLDAEEKLCFDVLRATNHRIAIGILSRFYSSQLKGTDADIGAVVRAVTAFQALWRGAKGGTAGIEAVHRTLLLRGNPEWDIPPLARLKEGSLSDMTEAATCVQTYLRLCLAEEGLGTREQWSESASMVPMYDHNREITRFLLLAATHDTMRDENEPGLLRQARAGVLPFLNYERWSDDASASVEHIAPQNPGEDDSWGTLHSPRSELIDCLGNLVLLPQNANSLISNRPWPQKRAMYQMLAARSREEIDGAKSRMEEVGLDIATDVLENSEYLPIVASVAEYSDSWNENIVTKRSQVLCELAWDRLRPWLGDE